MLGSILANNDFPSHYNNPSKLIQGRCSLRISSDLPSYIMTSTPVICDSVLPPKTPNFLPALAYNITKKPMTVREIHVDLPMLVETWLAHRPESSVVILSTTMTYDNDAESSFDPKTDTLVFGYTTLITNGDLFGEGGVSMVRRYMKLLMEAYTKDQGVPCPEIHVLEVVAQTEEITGLTLHVHPTLVASSLASYQGRKLLVDGFVDGLVAISIDPRCDFYIKEDTSQTITVHVCSEKTVVTGSSLEMFIKHVDLLIEAFQEFDKIMTDEVGCVEAPSDWEGVSRWTYPGHLQTHPPDLATLIFITEAEYMHVVEEMGGSYIATNGIGIRCGNLIPGFENPETDTLYISHDRVDTYWIPSLVRGLGRYRAKMTRVQEALTELRIRVAKLSASRSDTTTIVTLPASEASCIQQSVTVTPGELFKANIARMEELGIDRSTAIKALLSKAGDLAAAIHATLYTA